MKDGKVYQRILKEISQLGGLVFLVVDPPNQEPSIAGKLAKVAEEAGVNAIAVGGSVGAQGELLDKTILEIKGKTSLPVILFPGNIATLSKHADAIYFMSMLNSLDPYFITGAQIASAAPIKKLGLETISTSYIVVEPGGADSPAPPEMISYTKKMIEVPLVVAGGVRDERYAYETIKAGADIIHVGNAAEQSNGDLSQAKATLKKIVDGARKAGKEKR